MTLIIDSHANIASPGTVADDFEGNMIDSLVNIDSPGTVADDFEGDIKDSDNL